MEGSASLVSFVPGIIFFMVGTIAVAASILVVAMRNPVHSALFLLLTFLCVAVLFILAEAEFVGAVQVLVYAGGIMVLFLFVVMLINVRHLHDQAMLSRFWKEAILVGAALLAIFIFVVRSGTYHQAALNTSSLRMVRVAGHKKVVMPDGTTVRKKVMRRKTVGNSEAVGMALYTDYLVPFEVASLFLLVAMIGAIVIGKRELQSMDEDSSPDFILRRISEERAVKEAMGA
jgi:NADH-quinone oxidoreductase subunit J